MAKRIALIISITGQDDGYSVLGRRQKTGLREGVDSACRDYLHGSRPA